MRMCLGRSYLKEIFLWIKQIVRVNFIIRPKECKVPTTQAGFLRNLRSCFFWAGRITRPEGIFRRVKDNETKALRDKRTFEKFHILPSLQSQIRKKQCR